jgi:thymidylate synthase
MGSTRLVPKFVEKTLYDKMYEEGHDIHNPTAQWIIDSGRIHNHFVFNASEIYSTKQNRRFATAILKHAANNGGLHATVRGKAVHIRIEHLNAESKAMGRFKAMEYEDETPTFLIKSEDFHDAWYQIVSQLMKNGKILPSNEDGTKETRDATVLIELKGNAIRQILNAQPHPQSPLSSGQESYNRQFDYARVEFEVADSVQKYTYAGRLKQQIEKIQEKGLLVKYSRRIQLCTWVPEKDLGEDEVPCLQTINIRIISENKATVTLTWRAHDGYGAWNMNLIAILDFLTREFPDIKITCVKEFNASLHVYFYDYKKALEVRKPSVHDRLR